MLHEWYKSYAWYPVRRAARDPKRTVGGASRNAGSCPDCRNSSPWSRLSPLERKAVVRFPPLVARGVPQEQTSANQQSRAINCGITRPNSPHCFGRIEDTMADPESSKSGTGDVQHFARDDAPAQPKLSAAGGRIIDRLAQPRC